MAIIKCKMCGGDIELTADKTFGTCEYCGSTMTLPKVSDEQRAAAFNRGNHFRRIGEFDKALAVYERIVQEDDTDAEAHWCCALCRFGIEYVEDPTTYEWLPTCHRASFDSFLEDVDYLAAVEHSDGITRRQYQKDAAKIAEVQRGILATSQNEEPFDVFICYKESDENGERTRDSILAQDIYYRLTEQGRRVFFARITLEDKAGTEYEPYIFAALHSAKVMIAVGTKPAHFNAVWVKNEWSRFLSLMKKDRSKLLLPCYRDMDPYDLPEQLSVLQSYDMSKIGFLQDLIHGVSKVLDADKKPEPVKETVVVQQNAGGTNAVALLKRGNMALEDGEWEKADGFFEEVLNLDAECAEAYVGKLMAGNRQKSLEDHVQQRLNETSEAAFERLAAQKPDEARINTAVQRYTVPGFLETGKIKALYGFDLTYVSCLAARKAQSVEGKRAFDTDKLLSRAFRFAKGAYKETLEKTRKAYFDALDARMTEAKMADEASIAKVKESYAEHLKQAEEKAAELNREACARREQDYKAACEMQEKAKTAEDFGNAERLFKRIGDYADCRTRAEDCRNEAERLAAEKERNKQRKQRNIKIAVALVVVLAIATTLLLTRVILPSRDYSKAEALLAAGDYDAAAEAFGALGDYSDAAERVQATHYAKAEALLAAGDYDAAAEAFGAAGNYSDAADRILAVRYTQAEMLLAAGDYDGAVEIFRDLSLYVYEDAGERVLEARYAQAEALLSSGKYEEAAAAFENLKDYADSKQQVENCYLACYGEELYGLVQNRTVGDTLFFGKYEQDRDFQNGSEDIEWIVLEVSEHRIVLISKYILDVEPFNKFTTKSEEGKSWEGGCELRSWLNGFLYQAFEEGIVSAVRKNEDEPISLLSIDEYETYAANVDLQTSPTAYAQARVRGYSGPKDTPNAESWWLRTEGTNEYWADLINENGESGSGNKEIYHGVRPVLTIDLTFSATD